MFNERLSNTVYRHLPCSLKAGSILSRAIEGTPVAKFKTRELRMFSYIETSEPLNIYKEEDNKDKKEEAEESSSSSLKDEEEEEEENNEDEDTEEEVAVVNA
ncbi:Os12g0493300 [Oryza sativa Japonica Group]|nr:Os12g0493300 [Oryza sativa Japonica Group]